MSAIIRTFPSMKAIKKEVDADMLYRIDLVQESILYYSFIETDIPLVKRLLAAVETALLVEGSAWVQLTAPDLERLTAEDYSELHQFIDDEAEPVL